MIKTFRCKETEKIFNRQSSKKLPQNIQRAALKKLNMLDCSNTLEHLRIPPSNYLEKLAGDRMDQYSIRINNQWRICFVWDAQGVTNVEIIDYH